MHMFEDMMPNTPYRVLIVDDEMSCRLLEKEILSNSSYIISEASNGEEALAHIDTDEFDVVLLDKNMPGMSGDEVCQRVRNQLHLPLLPIVMVTGNSSDQDLVSSLQAGANDFIRKPYSPAELVARINAAAYQKRLTDQLDSAESLLFALARMVEAKDENSGDHCSRLSYTGVVFGKVLNLSDDDLLALCRGGVLHDIGKLGVPDSILLKNGPLNEQEWEIMRQHSVIGAQLCDGLKSMSRTLPIIRFHHERSDGSGYPEGLRGEEIPFLVQVFQIVDIYDALAHERPYKKAFSTDKIIAILKEEARKGWRDPELVEVFVDILRNDPESLQLPAESFKDPSAAIFERIVSTGVLDWGPKDK